MPSYIAVTEPSLLASHFWENSHHPEHAKFIESLWDQIKALCPAIKTFSFKLVDEAKGEGDSGGSSVLACVEPGTPLSIVDMRNSPKLVFFLFFCLGTHCGAVIGRDVKATELDFKVYALHSSGDSKCGFRNHVGKSVKRMMERLGDFKLVVPLPSTSSVVVQVFARPALKSSDLIYLPFGSIDFVESGRPSSSIFPAPSVSSYPEGHYRRQNKPFKKKELHGLVMASGMRMCFRKKSQTCPSILHPRRKGSL